MNGTAARLDPAAEALVFLGPSLGFERIAVPQVLLGEGDLLVRVELATVCGSDLHTVSGLRHEPVPLVLGHEQVGTVAALGAGSPATATDGRALAVGDRIVWGVAVACGRCRRCRRGMSNKCEALRKYGHAQTQRGWELSGGIATHVHVLARTPIVRVPARLPAEVLAPATCATATAAAALDAAQAVRPLAGELVVVTGCGMVGLTAVAMAAEAGATVVAVDPDPVRRERAREFGAAVGAAVGARALRDALAAAVAGDPRLAGADGFDVALEMSGAGEAVESLLACAGVGATIVLVGSVFPAPAVPLPAESVVRRLLTIRGVHNYLPEHLEQAVAFLERVDPAPFAGLVGETVPLREATRALTAPPATGIRTAVRP